MLSSSPSTSRAANCRFRPSLVISIFLVTFVSLFFLILVSTDLLHAGVSKGLSNAGWEFYVANIKYNNPGSSHFHLDNLPTSASPVTAETLSRSISSPTPSSNNGDPDGMLHYHHLCEPDHVSAQKNAPPRNPDATNIVDANLYLFFDGSASAYYRVDVWPSISTGEANQQRTEHYYRLYVFEMQVDPVRHLTQFNLFAEYKTKPNGYHYDFVQKSLLSWWTGGSPDVVLECHHSYSNDSSIVDEITPTILSKENSPDLQCYYSMSLQYQERAPTFTTLKFRKLRTNYLHPPPTPTSHANVGWENRWRLVPEFQLVLPWCKVVRPPVYISAFIKPVFGEPLQIAERIMQFIEWHRIIGVDHFYLYDRHGEIIQASETVAQHLRTKYSSNHSASQFHSLRDYINIGIVTYVPAPCQHPDPDRLICHRYIDHEVTGTTSLYQGRPHAHWMLQMDIDEFVYVFPPMKRPDSYTDPEPSHSPFKPAEILTHAQSALTTPGFYYPRECANSYYCKSPLRTFLEPMAKFGEIMYRTWNVPIGDTYPFTSDADASKVNYDISPPFVKATREKLKTVNSALDIDTSHRWSFDQPAYKVQSWQSMHEKYLCQPTHISRWGVHEAQLKGFSYRAYLMPDQGIYASHYKHSKDRIEDEYLPDSTLPQIMYTIPAPPLQSLSCRNANCQTESSGKMNSNIDVNQVM